DGETRRSGCSRRTSRSTAGAARHGSSPQWLDRCWRSARRILPGVLRLERSLGAAVVRIARGPEPTSSFRGRGNALIALRYTVGGIRARAPRRWPLAAL